MKHCTLKQWFRCRSIALVTGLLLWPGARAAETNAPPPLRRVAVVVDNRAGTAFDREAPVFEDFLAGRIARERFQVLSRRVVLDALRNFSAGGVSTNDTPGRKVDRALSDNTSALRLAQNLGADYVLLASIASYATERRTFAGFGIQTTNLTHILRVTYRLAEAVRGGEVTGDQITVKRTLRQTAGLQVENADMVNALLAEAADQLAASLRARDQSLPLAQQKPKRVKVKIRCTVTDFAVLPNVGLTEKNEVVIAPGHPDVYAMDVTVELNGIVIGSAPGEFEVPPGLNRLRLTREGFKPFDRIINTYDGQTLTVALQMTKEGFQRWKDVLDAYVELEKMRKLTDAQVAVMLGYAQALRQSGYRVDTKDNINVYRSLLPYDSILAPGRPTLRPRKGAPEENPAAPKQDRQP